MGINLTNNRSNYKYHDERGKIYKTWNRKNNQYQ